MIVGSPLHDYATSGNHATGTLQSAGAAYVYDAMLREQIPSIPNSGSWIRARLFGATNDDKLSLYETQNTSGPQMSYDVSGLLFTNSEGEIFIEASGFDSSPRGFIVHRPYIQYVTGSVAYGTPESDSINLYISGQPPQASEDVNLTLLGPDSAFVYNNMNLYTTSWNSIEVGSGTPPLNVLISGAIPELASGVVNVLMSGSHILYSPLNLRIRGK
jgi:hypothetical protein